MSFSTNRLSNILPMNGGVDDIGASADRFRSVFASTIDATTITNTDGVIDCDNNRMGSVAQPTAASDAANKTYVDNLVSTTVNGLSHKNNVKAVSVANVSATYANGELLGVGATLSSTGTIAESGGVAGEIGGYAVATGDSVLIANQTNDYENGIYVCTDVDSSPWILTRRTDNDTADQMAAAAVFVETGDAAEEGWRCTNDTGSITMGSTAITWAKYTGVATMSAGESIGTSGARLLNAYFSGSVDTTGTFYAWSDDGTFSWGTGSDTKIQRSGSGQLELTGSMTTSSSLQGGTVTDGTASMTSGNVVGVGYIQGASGLTLYAAGSGDADISLDPAGSGVIACNNSQLTDVSSTSIDPDSSSGGAIVVTNSTNQTSGSLVSVTGMSGQTALEVAAGDVSLGGGLSVDGTVVLTTSLADSNLATIATAGKVNVSAVDIANSTQETSGASSDLVLIYDASATANRSMTMSNLTTYISGQIDAIESSNVYLGVPTGSSNYWQPPRATTSASHGTFIYGQQAVASGDDDGGFVVLRGGQADGNGTGGDVFLQGGNSSSGTGGEIHIGTNQTSDIYFGTASPSDPDVAVHSYIPVTIGSTLAVNPSSASGGALTITNSTSQTSGSLVSVTGLSGQTAVDVAAGDVNVDGTVFSDTGFSGPASSSAAAHTEDNTNIVVLENKFTFDKDVDEFNCDWTTAGDPVTMSSGTCGIVKQLFDIVMGSTTTYDLTLDMTSFETRFIVLRVRCGSASQTYTVNLKRSTTHLGTDGFSVNNDDSGSSSVSPFVISSGNASGADWMLFVVDTAKADADAIVYANIGTGVPTSAVPYMLMEGSYPSPNTLSHTSDSTPNVTIGRSGSSVRSGFPLTQAITHTNVQYVLERGGTAASSAIVAEETASLIVVVAGANSASVKLLPRTTYTEVTVVQDATTDASAKSANVFTVDADGTTARKFFGFNISSMAEASANDARITRFLYMPHRGRWAIISTTRALDAATY